MEQLFHIGHDVERLIHITHVYRTLYDTEPGKEVVNRIAKHTFHIILQALKAVLVIGVARLLFDRAKSDDDENLSFHRLFEPKDTLEENEDLLIAQLKRLKKKHRYIRPARHKLFGHRDAATAREIADRFRREIENLELRQDGTAKRYAFLDYRDIDVLEAVTDISEFFSAYWYARFGKPFPYSVITDVAQLVEALSAFKENP